MIRMPRAVMARGSRDCSGVPGHGNVSSRARAHLVVGYLAGPASPMRVAVLVAPVLLASTRTRSLVVIWAVVAVCLPLWTLVVGVNV